jgi:hypothetical protein
MPASLDLYWIPLGAGTRVVRISGIIYEALIALVQRRSRRSLYHAALVASIGARVTTIEVAPIPNEHGTRDRGVVAEGAVGSRLLSRFRVFRYEVRRWEGGTIPDLSHAVGGPISLTADVTRIEAVFDLLPVVPTPVWGRDELANGEMWNSNSVIAWVLSRAGFDLAAVEPPGNGRAPGWHAGLASAAPVT